MSKRRRKLNQTGGEPTVRVTATCLGCERRFIGDPAFVKNGKGWCSRTCRVSHNVAV